MVAHVRRAMAINIIATHYCTLYGVSCTDIIILQIIPYKGFVLQQDLVLCTNISSTVNHVMMNKIVKITDTVF